MAYKLNQFVWYYAIALFISVIVGVIWTTSTGQSERRVYIWSAFIGMGIAILLLYIPVVHVSIRDGYLYDILTWLIIATCIVLALGFFITGMITASTGHSTDSLPYVISAVVSFAVLMLGWTFYNVHEV